MISPGALCLACVEENSSVLKLSRAAISILSGLVGGHPPRSASDRKSSIEYIEASLLFSRISLAHHARGLGFDSRQKQFFSLSLFCEKLQSGGQSGLLLSCDLR